MSELTTVLKTDGSWIFSQLPGGSISSGLLKIPVECLEFMSVRHHSVAMMENGEQGLC